MSEQRQDQKQQNFVAQLQKLVENDDRATLAQLRHSLSFPPGEAIAAFAFVERFTSSLEGWPREVYYLVAGLFATHPEHTSLEDESLGATFQRVYYGRGEPPSINQRFRALIAADDQQLGHHLRHAITLIRAEGLGVNYALLLSHLNAWNSEKQWVQQRWARDFYRPLDTESTEEAPEKEIA